VFCFSCLPAFGCQSGLVGGLRYRGRWAGWGLCYRETGWLVLPGEMGAGTSRWLWLVLPGGLGLDEPEPYLPNTPANPECLFGFVCASLRQPGYRAGRDRGQGVKVEKPERCDAAAYALHWGDGTAPRWGGDASMSCDPHFLP